MGIFVFKLSKFYTQRICNGSLCSLILSLTTLNSSSTNTDFVYLC